MLVKVLWYILLTLTNGHGMMIFKGNDIHDGRDGLPRQDHQGVMNVPSSRGISSAYWAPFYKNILTFQTSHFFTPPNKYIHPCSANLFRYSAQQGSSTL